MRQFNSITFHNVTKQNLKTPWKNDTYINLHIQEIPSNLSHVKQNSHWLLSYCNHNHLIPLSLMSQKRLPVNESTESNLKINRKNNKKNNEFSTTQSQKPESCRLAPVFLVPQRGPSRQWHQFACALRFQLLLVSVQNYSHAPGAWAGCEVNLKWRFWYFYSIIYYLNLIRGGVRLGKLVFFCFEWGIFKFLQSNQTTSLLIELVNVTPMP